MRQSLCLLLTSLILVACGGQSSQMNAREAPESAVPANPDLSDAARFGFQPDTSGTDQQAALPEGHPPLDGMSGMDTAAAIGAMGGSSAADVGLSWTLPEGWKTGTSTSSMRLATLVPAGATASEVSLVVLGGDAGGLVPNIQRWYQQMGATAPTADAIAQLPTVQALGQDCPLVDTTGDFSGMGREDVSAAGLIGTIVPLGGSTLFIKMTGPSPEVAAARDGFRQFCASIKRP